jgi:hypothetical protein
VHTHGVKVPSDNITAAVTTAVETWYKEKENYDFEKHRFNAKTENFTQYKMLFVMQKLFD